MKKIAIKEVMTTTLKYHHYSIIKIIPKHEKDGHMYPMVLDYTIDLWYTERIFKNQVFTLYICYIGTMPRLLQIETWFFGSIHCIKHTFFWSGSSRKYYFILTTQNTQCDQQIWVMSKKVTVSWFFLAHQTCDISIHIFFGSEGS